MFVAISLIARPISITAPFLVLLTFVSIILTQIRKK
nr:MAG TPA: hypothetical protein [Caudoviricetes sp.]